MKRKELEIEGKKWVREEIISEDQLLNILAKYPKKDHQSLLLTFAGIFIGLGFLTFIASNWSLLPTIFKLGIIIVSLICFYVSGEKYYQKGLKRVGVSFNIIGILIFGAGIFLTGQIYHFTFYDAFPFFVWALGTLLLFVTRQEGLILVLGIIILTVGQIYEAVNYQTFNYGLLCLLGLALLLMLRYRSAGRGIGTLFALSFGLQALILAFAEFYYAMFIPFMLVLYLLNEVTEKKIGSSLRLVSLLIMFGVNSVQVLVFGFDFIHENIEKGMLFHISYFSILAWVVLLKVIRDEEKYRLVDLILFLPVLYLGNMIDFASLILLFGFSLSYLVIGYQQYDHHKVNIGTAAFLVSTIIAYIQLAWDFLDKSLFFFIGGIFLFFLSSFLEKKRRLVARNQGGDNR